MLLGRVIVLVGCLGVVAAHQLRQLPAPWALAGSVAGLAVLAGLLWRTARPAAAAPVGQVARARRPVRQALGLLLVGGVAFAATVLWAQARQAQRLAPINVDQVVRVELRIESLPRLDIDRVQFDARVLHAHPVGVPSHIRVAWPAPGWRGPYAAPQPPEPPFPELMAGQVWRMMLVMRPVRAAQNLGAFDYERHLFAEGVRALGMVRGEPEYLRDEPWHSLTVVAQRARHRVREAMAAHLRGKRYGPVLRALVIGDQDGVDDADWQVFNRSGLTHLVSISGSHITMLAVFGALAAGHLWRRLRWRGRLLAERWPARRAAACSALLVAWLYCLLAGWGVPARRTFMMLAVVAGAQALQLRLSGSRVLALAAVAVVALDPWAILSSGFWLSFMAVGVLLAVGAQAEAAPRMDARTASRGRRWARALRLAAQLQWAVTWALVPPLAWLFHEVSLVSPVANAYAIPLIELVVTPLSLLTAAAALVPGLGLFAQGFAWLAHAVLWALMQPTQWLAGLPTIAVPLGPAWRYLLACLGVVLALWPARAWPARGHAVARHRHWAWLALLPMLCWTPVRPAAGDWTLHALDVGQGSAVLVLTQHHAVLFDAGARHARDADEGERTVRPALRTLGVGRLDALVVSHADLDHAGGVRSVLAGVDVEQTFSSFELAPWLKEEARRLDAQDVPAARAATPCRFGTHWEIDGVWFEFLWPLDEQARRPAAERNGASCVLRVVGRRHSLLLTGDIDAAAEAQLVRRGLPATDVVVAAHHGSNTASSAALVQATAARHVVFQAGRWNRFGHPHPRVLARWDAQGAQLWRTDHHGAVVLRSHGGVLDGHGELARRQRYWHGPRPAAGGD